MGFSFKFIPVVGKYIDKGLGTGKDILNEVSGGALDGIGDIIELFKVFMELIFKVLKNVPALIDLAINLLSDLPQIVRSLIELFKLTDDLILIGLKIIKFIFSDVLNLTTVIIEQFIRLSDPILKFIKFIVDSFNQAKQIPTIMFIMMPLLVALYILFYIIDKI